MRAIVALNKYSPIHWQVQETWHPKQQKRYTEHSSSKFANLNLHQTMIAHRVPDYLSEEEYLKLEAVALVKHEYIDGDVYAMAGASDGHVTIAGNCFTILRNRVRGGKCRVFMSDMKVKITTRRSYFYPDVMVTCDDRDREQANIKSHPKLIIEVLSESTEAFDRGDKFMNYQAIETLQEYVLINTKRPRVECFRRNAQGLWVLHSYELQTSQLGASVELASIDLTLTFDEIYEDVLFGDVSFGASS